ncbi:MAG: coproporphyrinogen III oxidase [Methylococcales bacterium]|jgi:coproporphyrinogen III oxidase|nr:coproporphyrinogen III oxidase [Methylococcales bacterium]MBT3507464.1 coproporphyrinogen III oxidase [Methylococcales bacterium]MBT3698051.1 coproporphyrinogen III oxidase [Methylococcales bacterium]MBT4032670.1 coproporphyrinogen III oxidase [Methylococcales bacterium]MBT4348472.1 coproporphyrinogen III oxidase [Methylococcales bacterium]
MSELVYSNSHAAGDAYRLVSRLQLTFVNGLETVARSVGIPCEMHNSEWFRDQGSHGGGNRFGLTGPLFNRSSVNISQVHYDDLPGKKLGSATALSTIIHPNNPLAPSLHLHLSWTEFKNKTGFWRLMADLNPAIEDNHATQTFNNCLKTVASKSYLEASLQGDRYFYIPVLKRHRGVAHFYLEGYQTERPESDSQFAGAFGQAVIRCYLTLLKQAVTRSGVITEAHYQQQLDYHTLYFLQVLTLDRGTTSGLLIHNQNDIGILASLPANINKPLLTMWQKKLPPPQNQLLANILAVLPEQSLCPIDDHTKKMIATTVRCHYQNHPEAIDLQANAAKTTHTVANHRG